MIESMPRPNLPYLHRYRTQHGALVWYVRLSGKNIRIREAFGTPEFDAAYRAAVMGTAAPKARVGSANTLAWLIDQYRDTSVWARARQGDETAAQQYLQAGHRSIR